MSGHSKWSTIKRKKGAADAQRSKTWAKLLRFVEVAARQGGGNVDSNPVLAAAVAKAKSSSVTNENIARAIARGTGEAKGDAYEEIFYEGYGPGGIAVLVHCLTDNRNRASQAVRGAFNGAGGKMAAPGAVAWMFEQKGVAIVPAGDTTEEDVFLAAADAGAEDVRTSDQSIEIVTPPEATHAVAQALEQAGIAVESIDITHVPTTTVPVEGSDAKKVLHLIDALEDLDDVQEVFANFDIPDEVLAALAS